VPKESDIVTRIKAYIGGIPKARIVKQHGNAFIFGEPDLYGCIDGRMFLIETKRPGKCSRPLQAAVQNKWRKAGALVITDATSVDDVRDALEKGDLV